MTQTGRFVLYSKCNAVEYSKPHTSKTCGKVKKIRKKTNLKFERKWCTQNEEVWEHNDGDTDDKLLGQLWCIMNCVYFVI